MTILVAHNYYQQAGGEDQVFAAETALLESKGHRVIRYEEHNSRIGKRTAVATAIDAVWNSSSTRSFGELLRIHRPDIVHFHNTFPLISPAAYYAVRNKGVPVVQTLHNYRLLCPGVTFFRDGAVCQECTSRQSLQPAIRHACYRQSRGATMAVATMLAVHRAFNTWRDAVDLYIAPSEFVRSKFIENGFRPEQIALKSNPVLPDPGIGDGSGRFALFVGRLSEEKGIRTLAAAWQTLPDVPLMVVGGGPLADTAWPAGATSLGPQPRAEVLRLMKSASVLIFPSLWYEGQPMTILESLACGLPVIGSRIGSIPELIEHGRTGRLFRTGDAADLAQNVRWAFDRPEELLPMRAAARREYDAKYTPEQNYKLLMDIYDIALSRRRNAA